MAQTKAIDTEALSEKAERGAGTDVDVYYVGPKTMWDACPLCTTSTGYPTTKKVLAAHKTEHVGYYWQPNFHSNMLDRRTFGPFATEAEARADAAESNGAEVES